MADVPRREPLHERMAREFRERRADLPVPPPPAGNSVAYSTVKEDLITYPGWPHALHTADGRTAIGALPLGGAGYFILTLELTLGKLLAAGTPAGPVAVEFGAPNSTEPGDLIFHTGDVSQYAPPLEGAQDFTYARIVVSRTIQIYTLASPYFRYLTIRLGTGADNMQVEAGELLATRISGDPGGGY